MIIANWKANGNLLSNLKWCKFFIENCPKEIISNIGIAPSALHIGQIKELLESSDVKIGIQDIDVKGGPRTGSISGEMAADTGCDFTLIGHSERRILLKEKNVLLKQKIESAYQANLQPILCIGETLEEAILNITIKEGFTVAYEPVWAIGTGNTPKPKDINVIHEFIKDVVQSQSSNDVIPSVLYGGSIHESNSEDFFTEKNIDGGLIGGASLDAKEFLKIVNIYSRLITQ
jgi:triosephosphate isomerase